MVFQEAISAEVVPIVEEGIAVGSRVLPRVIPTLTGFFGKLFSSPPVQKAAIGAATTAGAFLLASGELPSKQTVLTATAFGLNPLAAGTGLVVSEFGRQKELFLSPDVSTKNKVLTAGADLLGIGSVVGAGLLVKNIYDSVTRKDTEPNEQEKDIKLAKIQANSAKELAEIQSSSSEKLLKQQIELANIQANSTKELAKIQAEHPIVQQQSLPTPAVISTTKEERRPPQPPRKKKKSKKHKKRKKKRK